MPPSAMIGTFAAQSAARQSTSACSCGTPKLVVMRVVQPPPGPMPTFTALAPRSARKRAPSAVATFPAITSASGNRARTAASARSMTTRVAMGDVDHQHVGAGTQQLGRALDEVTSRADCRAHPQAAEIVARGKRQAPLPQQVSRRDEPEQGAIGGARAAAS